MKRDEFRYNPDHSSTETAIGLLVVGFYLTVALVVGSAVLFAAYVVLHFIAKFW